MEKVTDWPADLALHSAGLGAVLMGWTSRSQVQAFYYTEQNTVKSINVRNVTSWMHADIDFTINCKCLHVKNNSMISKKSCSGPTTTGVSRFSKPMSNR